jgi:hypothetical protein
VDAVLRGDDRKLVRGCQYPESKTVSAGEVRELAALRSAGGFGDAALFVTTALSQDARRAAASTGVEVRDGEGLVALAREVDVAVPAPERPPEGLPRRTAGWPEPLLEAAGDLLEHVESEGSFERRTTRTSAAVDVDYLPETGDAPVVKVRFGDETVRTYVRHDGRFSRVGTLTPALTERTLPRLTRELDASIRRALAE